MKHSALFFFICIASLSHAQNTMGLISYNPLSAYDGYSLIYPHNQPNVYLLNNCGQVVHSWTDSAIYAPGNEAFLLENGNLIKTKRKTSVVGDSIWAGGGGGDIEIRDWDNNLIWKYTLNNGSYRLHHDITVMPNGNILAIAWENLSAAQAIQEGRDSNALSEGELWPDMVLEIKPINSDSFEIVWEWRSSDHLIQNFDITKNNYGDPSLHPELIDINYFETDVADWMHSNSIDYNATFDQVLLSVPTFNEIWIIDHSTTTSQAASHTGGFSGKGGDLIFRWGNPEAYGQGTATDQKLFYQHDAHWMDIELPNGHPDKGKIIVFNNRVSNAHSTANIIAPIFDTYEWEYPLTNNTFEPSGFDWSYQRPDSAAMYSTGLASVQRLPNGNTLFCVGRPGYLFEIDPQENIVWEYINPMIAGAPATQGNTIPLNANLLFRITRYGVNYPAFAGRDLSSVSYLELNPDTNFCNQILDVPTAGKQNGLRIYPVPAYTQLTLEIPQYLLGNAFRVISSDGRIMLKFTGTHAIQQLDVKDLKSGIYFIQAGSEVPLKFIKH